MNARDPGAVAQTAQHPSTLEGDPAFNAGPSEKLEEARPVRGAGASRKSLVQDSAASVGDAWARALCETMRREGRLVEGGWPGTVVEARARVAAGLADALARRNMSPLTGKELSEAIEIAYGRARQQWLARLRQARAAARRARARE